MPSEELRTHLREQIQRYFIIRVEDMYRHVQQRVPASRSVTHTCLYITEGEAIMSVGGETYHIGRHQMLFVPAGQVFSFQPYHQNRGFLIVFEENLVGPVSSDHLTEPFEFLRVWGNPMVKLNETAGMYAVRLLERLLDDYAANGLKNTGLIQSYLQAFLAEVSLLYQPLEQSNGASAGIAKRFKEVLFSQIRDKKRVADYAALLHVSPNHLNKSIKQTTGKSPTRWIDEALVAEAKILLLQSDLTIYEIARDLGMEDPSYFTRFFKKYEGVTPTFFRKMIDKS